MSFHTLTKPDFDLSKFSGGEKDEVKKQRKEIREEYNKADKEWRQRREIIGLLLSFYHQGSQEVSSVWRSTMQSVDAYSDCARSAYVSNTSDEAPCENKMKSLADALDALNIELKKRRRYAWEGWESPEAMKQTLRSDE